MLAALGGAAFMAPAAKAATAADGDLFLGFRATGGTGSNKCYMVNIGQASQFKNAAGPLTLNLGSVSGDLGTIFGGSWMDRADVFWGIAGSTGSFDPVGTDPAKTIYASRQQVIVGTQTTPWQRKSDTTQGTTTSKFGSLKAAFVVGTATTATNSVSQNTTDANSWSSFQPGGTTANSGPAPGVSFAAFNPSIEGTFANGTEGSVLDLYRMAAATIPSEVNTNGDYLGRFILSDAGVLTFVPVAAFGSSTVNLAAATASVSEDVVGGQVTVTVNRTGDVSSAASVQVSTTNDTALGGTDFTAISGQVVSFGINETSKTLNVAIANRAGFQGDRAFTVNLGTPGSGVTIGATGSETVTITEAVEPSVVQLSADTYNANQNDTTVNVTLSRTGGGSAVTVQLSTADDTAVAGTDFTAITNQVVTIPANVNSVNVPVTLSAPAADQGNKSFNVTIASPGANASLGARTSAVVRILANDSVIPTVTITTPKNKEVFKNGTLGGTVSVTGKATDAKEVSAVQVSLNGGAFADATLNPGPGPGTIDWSFAAQPAGGVTTLQVRAIDARGNVSLIATSSFTYTVKGTLTVIAGPGGTVSGGLAGAVYEIGKTYKVTAKAGTGNAFNAWTGEGITGTPAAELAVLSFVYTAQLAASPTLTASFVANPYANDAATGTFAGLVKAHTGTVASNSTNGHLTVTVTKLSGAFSGTLKIDGAALPVKGVFDNAGVAKFDPNRSTTLSVARKEKAPYVLSLTLDTNVNGTQRVTGSLKEFFRSTVVAESDVVLNRAVTVTPAGLLNAAGGTKGFYTVILPATTTLLTGATLAAADCPQGDSAGTISLTKTGGVTFVATLSDGTTKVTSTAQLDKNQASYLFTVLYKTGSIGGNFVFSDLADTDVKGTDLFWFRPYQAVHYYPFGWPEGLATSLAGTKFPGTVVGSVVPALPAVNASTGNATLTLSDGGLGADVVKSVNITTTNVASNIGVPPDASFKLVLTAAVAKGEISGEFTHTDGTKPKYYGVILNKGANKGAFGHFLTVAPKVATGSGLSGGVSLIHK